MPSPTARRAGRGRILLRAPTSPSQRRMVRLWPTARRTLRETVIPMYDDVSLAARAAYLAARGA